MSYKVKLDKKDRKNLWDCVREIIKENHNLIITKSASLRDSQYIVRDILNRDYLPTEKVTEEIIRFFMNEQDAYTYFTQDIWTQLEREGYERPTAKPIGIFYWESSSYTVDKINSFIPQIQGYIYVEKEGIASKLKELSNYGWGVVAAQGQATREIRDLIKRTGKPCLIIHDYDPDGETIANSILSTTRRTTHLNIANENARDFLLNDEQADYILDKYNVPTQLLPPKHVGKWKRDYRIELSAFVVLKESDNPILDFVKAEMKRQGIPLCLRPISKNYLFLEAVKQEVEWQINDIVEKILGNYKIKGEACKAKLLKDIDIKNDDNIKLAIKHALRGVQENVEFISKEEMQEKALEEVPIHWINREVREDE